MAKLSTQLLSKKSPTRVSRTQRVASQQLASRTARATAEEQRKQKVANDKISGANYSNYETVYNSIAPKYRSGFQTPEQIYASSGYAQYQLQQSQSTKINFLIDKASKADRGKMFVMWGESDADIKLLNAYREGVGTGTKKERRSRFLQQTYGSISAGAISQAVASGTVTDFGVRDSGNFGTLDVGEKTTVIIKDALTGKAKSVKTYEKTKFGNLSAKRQRDMIKKSITEGTKRPQANDVISLGKSFTYQSAKQQQDQAVADWQIERATKQAYDPIQEPQLSGATQPNVRAIYDMNTGTASLGNEINTKWYDKSPQELFIQPAKKKVGAGFKWLMGKGGGALNFVYDKSPQFYVKPISEGGGISTYERNPINVVADIVKNIGSKDETRAVYDLNTGTSTLGSSATFNTGGRVKLSDVVDVKGRGKVAEKKQKNYDAMLKDFGIDVKVDKEIQTEGQLRFEDLYAEKIIRGEIPQDQAVTEFQEGDTGKYLEKKYGLMIEKELRGTGLNKKSLKYGFKSVGYNFADLGLRLIPTSTGEALVTAGAVYTGVKVASLIPASATYTVSGGFLGLGTYKTFSPTSTPEERASGITTAVVSSAVLGYGALKYARSPVVKTVKIKPPKQNLKTYSVGKEGTNRLLIQSREKIANVEKLVFAKQQKLYQVGVAGRRTTVTTKWRSVWNKPVKVFPYGDKSFNIYKFDKIYEGVPYAQKGTTYTTPSGYEKATKLLEKYGYSSSQASQTLRYYAPKVFDTVLEKGTLRIVSGVGKTKAYGDLTTIRTQPVIDVNKELGIKTRGGTPIRSQWNFKREVTGNIIFKQGGTIKNYPFVTETGKISTSFVTKGGYSYNKLTQAGRTTTKYTQGSIVKVGDIKKMLRSVQPKGIIRVKPYNYQEIQSLYSFKQVSPLKRKIRYGEGRTGVIKSNIKSEIKIDLDQIRGNSPLNKYFVDKSSIPKSPFAKTYGANQVDDIVREIKKITGTGSKTTTSSSNVKAIKNIIDKSDDLFSSSPKQSKFYGTGLYEKSSGGMMPQQQILQSTDISALKGVTTPSFTDATIMKDILNVGTTTTTGIKTASLFAVGSQLKFDNALKMDLKMNLKMDQALKEDVIFKDKTVQITSPVLKTSLKNLLKTDSLFGGVTTGLSTPSYKPTPPTPKPPRIIIPPFILKGAKAGKKKKKKDNIGKLQAYLPDFTSRSLGLNPDVISGKQAQARVKKVLSGLEIRRGIKIQ